MYKYQTFMAALPKFAEQYGIGWDELPVVLMISLVSSTYMSLVDASLEEQEEVLELLIKDIRQNFATFQAIFMNAEKN